MGTNYYLHEDCCATCGRGNSRLHIGKSSGGWCFSLHVDPLDGINTLGDWIERWSKPNTVIKDEYGDTVSRDDMLAAITERSWKRKQEDEPPLGYVNWDDFHSKNHSEPGPNGLLRHRPGQSCIAHGDGTYDLITGEFA